MSLKTGSRWSNWAWDKPVKAFIWRSSRICRPIGGLPLWFFEDSLPHLLLRNNSIIHVDSDARLEGNVNGPSLIVVPSWVNNPLGRYHLYFAHHEGRSIRLAYANDLAGPWTLYEPGALRLEDSRFSTTSPHPATLHPQAKHWFEAGID